MMDNDPQIDLEGKIVITSYGKIKTFKLKRIDHDRNPGCMMNSEYDGRRMTYIEYFYKKYGIKIEDEKQSLVLSPIRDQKIKN